MSATEAIRKREQAKIRPVPVAPPKRSKKARMETPDEPEITATSDADVDATNLSVRIAPDYAESAE